jgi:hypothetical protein
MRTANVQVSASAGDTAGGATAHADGNATASWTSPSGITATRNATADAPPDQATGILSKTESDPKWVPIRISVSNGIGVCDVPFSLTVSANARATVGSGGGGIEARAAKAGKNPRHRRTVMPT